MSFFLFILILQNTEPLPPDAASNSTAPKNIKKGKFLPIFIELLESPALRRSSLSREI